jgi:hypothetical protein
LLEAAVDIRVLHVCQREVTAGTDETILPEVGLICRVQALPARFMVIAVGVEEGTELKVL